MTPARPTPRHYGRVFGLGIESTRPLTGLLPLAQLGHVDLRVHFGAWSRELRAATTPAAPPAYVSPFADSAGTPLSRGWDLADGSRHLIANDGSEVLIDRDGGTVWIWAPALVAGELDAWVVGPVLALVLRRRGTVCLHASVVLTADGAVAFAGAQGTGKSTLAAVLAMRGVPVVTDDVAAILASEAGDPVRIHPGAASLRARVGMLAEVAARVGQGRDLAPTADGRYLDLDLRRAPYRVASIAAPLRELYYLDARLPAAGAAASMEPLRGADAVMALAGDTWGTRWLSPSERAAEFDLLTRLAREVPMWRVPAPSSVASLLTLADVISNGREVSGG